MTTTLPKVPFQLPKTGVVAGVHPREVGWGGLLFGRNFINRDGIHQFRDGVRCWPLLTDGTLGDEDNIQVDSGTDHDVSGQVALGLYQYDFQEDGVYENDNGGDPSKDRLVVVTDLDLYYKDPTAALAANNRWYKADHATLNADFALPFCGWTAPDGDDGVQTKLTINWEDINWSAIETEAKALDGSFGNIAYIWVAFSVVGLTDTYQYSIYAQDDSVTQRTIEVTDTDEDTGSMPDTAPVTIPIYIDTGTATDSGVSVTINDADWDVEMNVGDYPQTVTYEAAVFEGSTYDHNDLPLTDIFAGDRDNPYTIRAWDYDQKTHVLVASPNNFVAVFDGSTVNIAGMATECPLAKSITIAGQRLVAGNVAFIDAVATVLAPGSGTSGMNWIFAHYPDGVIYSETVLTGGHTVWIPTNIMRLSDTPGEIITGLEMGTMMDVIYKTDAIYVLAVQTGLSAFRPDLRASGIQGPVGPLAVAALSDNLHVYLGRDGALYFFDGSPPRSIGSHIQNWITAEMDNDYAHRAWLAFNKENHELVVMYPTKGSGGKVRKGLIIDIDAGQPFPSWPAEWDNDDPPDPDWDFVTGLSGYLNMDVALGDIHAMLGDVEGVLDISTRDHVFIMMDSDEGRLHNLDPGTADEYARDHLGAVSSRSIYGKITTGLSDFGAVDRLKFLGEVEILAEKLSAAADLTVTLYGGNTDSKFKQLGQETIDLSGDAPYFVEFREEARYFALDMEIAATEKVQIGGALAAIKARGRVR